METENALLQELAKFLNYDLLYPKPKPPTFLQLAEMPHYENVISNIYAFFLQPNEAHGFGDMFLQALLSEIGSDIICAELKLESVAISREVVTDNGNRIDLLVSVEDLSLIIENKIYHHDEFNPFHDYWNFVKTAKKIGIVISLDKNKSKHRSFVNITHKNYMNRVKSLLPNYFSSASAKFIVYLQDFFQDIDSLYPMANPETTAAVNFFIANKDKFAQLEKIKQQADNFKLQEIGRAAHIMELTVRSTGATDYRYIDLYNAKGIRLSYEVWVGDLYSNRSCMIRLCSTGEDAKLTQ